MADSFTKTFEKLKRQSFRKSVNKIWGMIKEGQTAELGQEELKLWHILLDHQEYHEHFENNDVLDGSEYELNEGFNPFLHISLHQMAEDQITLESPIEAAMLCESIEKMGHTRHEAIHVIIMILIHVIFDAFKKDKIFNEERYLRLLIKCRKVPISEMQSVVERDFTSN
ncbi:MAG: hypothetical protein CSYNP_01871 [Syntrophus sp. SKADARSKE-3]|nr:hypothetical protein [Syntrophus sp. SKADARSKE-3]